MTNTAQSEPGTGRMSRRAFLSTSVAVGAGLVAAGCGGSPTSAAKGSSSAPGGKHQRLTGTLTFYDHQAFSSNATGKHLISEYEKLHPGVKINIVSAPAAQIDTYVNTLMEGGSPPDLFVMATNMSPWQNIKDNWWANLTSYANAPNPYVKGNKHWTDLVLPGVLPTMYFRHNEIYSMTTTGFDVAFFYNKSVFSKLKVDPPTTWAELISALEKAKHAGYIPFFCCLGELQYGDQTPGLLMILQDTIMNRTIDRLNPSHPSGAVTVAELVKRINDRVYSAKNADYQESWKLFKSLAPYMQRGPASANDSSIGLAAFESGKVATWFEGSFNAPSITKVDWGAFVVPNLTPQTTKFSTTGQQRKGAYGATAGYPFAIPTASQKNGKFDLAMDFVYWMSTPAQSERFAAANGVLDLNRHGKNAPDLGPFVQAANTVSRLSVAELALPQNFFITRAKLLEGYVLGQFSLGTAMSQMQTLMEQSASQAKTEFGL